MKRVFQIVDKQECVVLDEKKTVQAAMKRAQEFQEQGKLVKIHTHMLF